MRSADPADLFGVSRGTIRNVIDDVRPFLDQDQSVVTPDPGAGWRTVRRLFIG